MATKKELEGIDVIKIPSGHVMFISDIHFGWNVSSEEWQDNIADYFRNWFIPYLRSVKERNHDLVLFCLGDVFHDRKSIDIDVNNLVMDVFEEISGIVPVYVIYGNHDLSKKTNKGNSSLRSLTNIGNLYIIKDVSHVKFVSGRSVLAQAAAIPYLGDCSKENRMLLKFCGTADYAFMHTDISDMRFDNGMTIVGGVDSDKFTGRIYAGHIHKRQENKRVTYVGSPYQLSAGEIGNVKGIYVLDVATGETEFTPNEYSPVFQKIDAGKFMEMESSARVAFLRNNYTDILVNEDDIDKKYKLPEIYDAINGSGSKRAEVKVVRSKVTEEIGDTSEYVEMSLEELINASIDAIDDVDDEKKAELKKISAGYFKNAVNELGKS